MPHPSAFREILGTSFVTKQSQPVLTVGDALVFDKYTLVHDLACSGSYRAARLLTKALSSLGVKSLEDIKRLDVTRLAKLKGVGVTTLYLFLCLREREGGGIAKRWYGNRPSFSTIQRRVRKKQHGPR